MISPQLKCQIYELHKYHYGLYKGLNSRTKTQEPTFLWEAWEDW